jgi:uncharacterized protein (DUF1499 family)
LVAAGLVLLLKLMPAPSNFAQTSPQHADPQLRTRRYRGEVKEVAQTVREVASNLRTYGRVWESASADAATSTNASRIQLAFVVPVLVFKDDLVVKIQSEGEFVLVNVRSQSRVGKGDLGENRRHVLQLLHALDTRLAK